MSVTATALTFRNFSARSPAMALLRSQHLPVVLGFVQQYFPGPATQRPVHEVYELFDADLRTLRVDGFDLPKGPQAYVSDWVKAGWLVRRPGSARTGETVEPSEEVLAVLSTVERWDKPHRSVNASRIESIGQAIQTLALESDPELGQRLDSLQRQRDEIQAQIDATSRGEYDVLSPTQVRQRIEDILDLTSAIPGDFAAVRHEFEDLNRALRRQLLDPEESRGDVLDEIFRGVDLIGDSDAGKSFTGFYDVLLDRERSARLDTWTVDILGRDSTRELPDSTRRAFHLLFRDLEQSSYEVSQEMTGLARSLRHYVTTEEFAENRRLVELLRETRAEAARAAQTGEVGALTQLGTQLTRIGMPVSSIAALRLRNPGEEVVQESPQLQEDVPLDAETLLSQVRASEIDFAELEDAVRVALEQQPQATIAEVLTLTPATQGLASVVGLIILAIQDGFEVPAPQQVSWVDAHDQPVSAAISGWTFNRRDHA